MSEGFIETLKRGVVDPGLCLGCGACIIACPLSSLTYVDEGPKLTNECLSCGVCARVCPQYIQNDFEMEQLIFGRGRGEGEEFGVYRRIAAARAGDAGIREIGQDGGAVTALLHFALRRGIIDGAIVAESDPEKPLNPKPRLVSAPEDVIKAAGSKYFYSPNLFMLKQVVAEGMRKVAFVGTPCQIRALRRMRTIMKCADSIAFSIGLLCSECFTYEGLVKKCFQEELNIDPMTVRKMSIKENKLLLQLVGSETREIPLPLIKKYKRVKCAPCKDFSAEFADISAGGLGLKDWTLLIVRTEIGEEILSLAEKENSIEIRKLDDENKILKLLNKISAKKRSKQL